LLGAEGGRKESRIGDLVGGMIVWLFVLLFCYFGCAWWVWTRSKKVGLDGTGG
jgi:hypothetical protein